MSTSIAGIEKLAVSLPLSLGDLFMATFDGDAQPKLTNLPVHGAITRRKLGQSKAVKEMP